MDDRFQMVLRKFEHAKRHVETLKQLVGQFIQSEPYQLGFRIEPDQRPAYFVQKIASLPAEIPCALGDILHNLRCSLDHLAYQLVLTNAGSKAVRLEKVDFPICASQDIYNKRKASSDQFFSSIDREVLIAVDRLRPYKGGDERLWRLHALNNIDKHRMVVTAGGNGASIDLGLGYGMVQSLKEIGTCPDHVKEAMIEGAQKLAEQPLFYNLAEPLFPLKEGDVFFYGAKGATFNPTVKLKIYIAVGESTIVNAMPVDQLIDELGQAVSHVLNQLKVFLD